LLADERNERKYLNEIKMSQMSYKPFSSTAAQIYLT
jgi:hypothetical protein